MKTKLEDISFKLDEEKLKLQVNSEYGFAFSTVSLKRQLFREQDKLFANTANQDKIDLRTVFYNTQAKLAQFYTDKKNIKWMARRFGMEKQADRLNKLSNFDVEEMKLPIINLEVENNRVRRWVGISALQGWDKRRKCPKWRAIDTMNWIPDPNWWLDPEWFRFHWFDVTATFAQLSQEDTFFNHEKLADDLITQMQVEWNEQQITRVKRNMSSGLNPTSIVLAENPVIYLYYHYTRYYDDDGKCHTLQTCWWSNRSVLVKVQEVLPVYKEEKENPEIIPFPVNLKYFFPEVGNPYGISLVDLIMDKHKYKNVLANLMFLKEKDVALGDDVIFDTNIIKNPNDLVRPTMNKKFIGADGRQWPISGALMTVPRNPAPPSNYNFINFLDQASSYVTWQDARQMWVTWSNPVTLGEAQQLQENANVIAKYTNIIGKIGDVNFWKLWLRSYHENFTGAEKKVIRVTDAFGTKNIEFTKEDFLTEEDPDITIELASEEHEKNEKNKLTLWPILMQMAVDPNLSQFNRKNIQCKLLEMNGVNKDELELYVKEIPEVLDAMNLLELINNNIEEWAVIDPATADTVDHSVYIAVFKQALDIPLKYKAIEARKQMIIQLWMQAPIAPQGQQNAMANMATGSMLNQAWQSQNNIQSRTSNLTPQ